MATSSANPDLLAAYGAAGAAQAPRLRTGAATLKSALDAFRSSPGRAEFIADVPEPDLDLRFLAQRWERLAEWVSDVGQAFRDADTNPAPGPVKVNDAALDAAVGRYDPPEAEVILQGGRVVIDAGAGEDEVEITYLPKGGVRVEVNGEVVYEGDAPPDLAVRGNAGDDDMDANPLFGIPLFGSSPLTLDGGAGGDRIRGGPGGNTLRGGEGDDEIIGGSGADTIFGGAGRDTLGGGAGDDRIDGGEDDDLVAGGDGADDISTGAGADTVDGGGGDDTIDTGADDDEVTGGAGDDDIAAGDGRDYVAAGAGDDQVDGGAGGDVVYAGGGIDVVHGGDGDDYVDGGAGDDIVYGDGDHDVVSGGEGDDNVDGGDGDDVLYAGPGEDVVFSGGGDDHIYVEAGDTAIAGDRGDQVTEVTIDLSFLDEIHIQGSPEFQERVRADLVTMASSPTGQEMLEGLRDTDGNITIVETDLGNSISTNGDDSRVNYNPAGIDLGGEPYQDRPPIVGLFHEFAHGYNHHSDTTVDGVYLGPDQDQVPEDVRVDTDGDGNDDRTVVLDSNGDGNVTFDELDRDGDGDVGDDDLDLNGDGDVDRDDGFTPNSERQAVGLGVDHDEDPRTPDVPASAVTDHPDELTENALRDEFDIPLRPRY